MISKKILIISPQPWDHLMVSKHHYAMELALSSNAKVYFLEPPQHGFSSLIEERVIKGFTSLSVLTYKWYIPQFLIIRYHFTWIYDLLINIMARRIARLHGIFDEVWCFDANIFSDLSIFSNRSRILFPVDLFSAKRAQKIAYSADIILTVSDSLRMHLSDSSTPVHVIGHGLSAVFVDLALNIKKKIEECEHLGKPPKMNFGYAGNLAIQNLDRVNLLNIVTSNHTIAFHFWGNTSLHQDAEDKGFTLFIKTLSQQKNVFIHGIVNPAHLAQAYTAMDGFLVCYDFKHNNPGDNSHKILEYLSTGKVVISNYFPQYEIYRNLIVMPEGYDNDELLHLFVQVIRNWESYHTRDKCISRCDLSLSHSYKNKIEMVYSLLEGVEPI